MAGFSILQEAAIPFNGSGSFSLAEPAFVPNTTISSAAMNSDLSDIADGLSECLTTDGQSTMSAAIKGFAGTVTAPGYSFSIDPNTGIYRIASDNIGVSAGGTKILDIASTGLGVTGNLSATGNLSVTGNFSFSGTVTGSAMTLTGLLTLSSTSHMLIPNGTTAQRPVTPAASSFRYNSDTTLPEFADGSGFFPLSAAQPIPSGFKNLVITNNAAAPDSQIDVDADAVTVETAAGRAYRLTGINLTINSASVGANGIDAGSLASGTWYAIYVIYNPGTDTTAGLISTSATSPALPSGYTAFSRFGWIRTAGTAQFYGILQKGNSVQYVVGLAQTAAPRQIFSAANTGYASQSVSNFVPSTASSISFLALNSANVSNWAIAPNGSYSFAGGATPPQFQVTNAVATVFSLSGSMMLESTNIYQYSSTGTMTAYCYGWDDNI